MLILHQVIEPDKSSTLDSFVGIPSMPQDAEPAKGTQRQRPVKPVRTRLAAYLLLY
jgi:hypothetical protein